MILFVRLHYQHCNNILILIVFPHLENDKVGSGYAHSTADKELIGFQDVKQLSIKE